MFISHSTYLRMAAEEAFRGVRNGGLAEGAVLVVGGCVAGTGHRQAHAGVHASEICLADAGVLHPQDVSRSALYLTHWPCPSCFDIIRRHSVPLLVVAGPGDPQILDGIEVLRLPLLEDAGRWQLRPGAESP